MSVAPEPPSTSPVPGRSRLEVGRVGRAHGLGGEVAVTFTSNRPERTTPGARLFVGERELEVVGARRHGGRWLIRFGGVNDRTAAEALLGVTLQGEALDPGDGGELPEGEFWIHELVGSEVFDLAGTRLGVVTAVEANPAHDLLVLDGGGLIPIVFVVSSAAGRVVVDPPDGLFDL